MLFTEPRKEYFRLTSERGSREGVEVGAASLYPIIVRWIRMFLFTLPRDGGYEKLKSICRITLCGYCSHFRTKSPVFAAIGVSS